MRVVSESLLAAQRLSTQRPRARVLVRDKQPRMVAVGSQAIESVACSACTSQAGDKIVTAVLDGTGCIRVRDVTNPTVLSAGQGWGSYPADYTQVVAAAGALGVPAGDIAISENGGTLRIFYVKADGTEILTISRADAGGSWSSPATVGAVAGGSAVHVYHLAAGGHDDVWMTRDEPGAQRVYMSRLDGTWGGWISVADLVEGGGEYETFYGMSVVWDAAVSKYAVVASMDRAAVGDGWIVSCRVDLAGVVTSWQTIVPPGYPLVGFVPWRPALLKAPAGVGSVWVLTYWDTFDDGVTSWASSVCLWSWDFAHWSYKIPMAFATWTPRRRIQPVAFGSTSVYLYMTNAAYSVELWYAGKTSAELTVPQGKVLRYRMIEAPENGQLNVELVNRGGVYDDVAALRPLAGVTIEQGLNTSSGDVVVQTRPFYLWSHSIVRDMGANVVRLHCLDGWQLLRMWRPDCTIEWVNHTLEWCIAEVAARVGGWKVITDGYAEWSEVLNYLTVAASYDETSERWYIRSVGRWLSEGESVVMLEKGVSGLTMLQHLLGLVGGVARFGNAEDREVLYCFIPAKSEEALAHTYGDGEVLSVESVRGFAWPTRVLVSAADASWSGVNADAAADIGMEILQMEYASQWTTAEQMQDMGLGLLDDGQARASGGKLKIRPNVGLELFDRIMFTDSKAGSGLADVVRRVNGLDTEYDPSRKVWLQTLAVEAD